MSARTDLCGGRQAIGVPTATGCDQAERKIAEIQQKIRSLYEMHGALEHLVEQCASADRPMSECRILESLASDDPLSDDYMTVEVFYLEGCPSADRAADRALDNLN